MSIKTFKPTTPSRRQMTVSGFDGIDKKAKPEASLLEPLKKKVAEYVFYKDLPYADIKIATLGNDAGIIGAAMLGK